jgi:hypothetical protein
MVCPSRQKSKPGANTERQPSKEALGGFCYGTRVLVQPTSGRSKSLLLTSQWASTTSARRVARHGGRLLRSAKHATVVTGDAIHVRRAVTADRRAHIAIVANRPSERGRRYTRPASALGRPGQLHGPVSWGTALRSAAASGTNGCRRSGQRWAAAVKDTAARLAQEAQATNQQVTLATRDTVPRGLSSVPCGSHAERQGYRAGWETCQHRAWHEAVPCFRCLVRSLWARRRFEAAIGADNMRRESPCK